jgi:hypothetical protein
MNGLGIFAGLGIILIGRAAGGILGIEAIQIHLPWVKRAGADTGAIPTAPLGPPAVVPGGTRAAG